MNMSTRRASHRAEEPCLLFGCVQVVLPSMVNNNVRRMIDRCFLNVLFSRNPLNHLYTSGPNPAFWSVL